MGICIIILAGYEVQRHLYGIRFLSKLGIDRIYILYDNINPEYKKVVEGKAENIYSKVSEVFDAELKGCNPRDMVNLFRIFTYIMLKHRTSEIYIDLTNTTKQALLAATVFSTAFGIKMYYVTPAKYVPIDIRIEETFSKLKKDTELSNILFSQWGKSENFREVYEKYFEALKTKYIQKVEEMYETRAGEVIEEVPLTGNLIKLDEISDLDKKILSTLFHIDEKKEIVTITELSRRLGMEGKRNMAIVGYRIRQLERWRFVKVERGKVEDGKFIVTERGKLTKITLTDFGKGFISGIKDFEEELKSKSQKFIPSPY
jgi:hypothetical protein